MGDDPWQGGAKMKLKDIMSNTPVKIRAGESVAVAARLLASYHIGALPVCDDMGRLRGMVTDRDLVVRCMALSRRPEEVTVEQVMTRRVVTASPEMETGAAAHLMGREQVRRLPVVENGKLCGMVSVADLTQDRSETAQALVGICDNIRRK